MKSIKFIKNQVKAYNFYLLIPCSMNQCYCIVQNRDMKHRQNTMNMNSSGKNKKKSWSLYLLKHSQA